MTRHKIVAYKITGDRTGLVVQALTESPRGTRIPFALHRMAQRGDDREAFTKELESAILEMQSSSE